MILMLTDIFQLSNIHKRPQDAEFERSVKSRVPTKQ